MNKGVCKAKRKPNYGMLNMNVQLKEVVGNKFELVGPMVESYLHKIGKSMKYDSSGVLITGRDISRVNRRSSMHLLFLVQAERTSNLCSCVHCDAIKSAIASPNAREPRQPLHLLGMGSRQGNSIIRMGVMHVLLLHCTWGS